MAGEHGMFYVIALQTAQQLLELRRKPTLTAALIVANTLVHFRPGPLDRILPHLEDVCLNPYLILEGAKGVCKRIAICFGLGLARRRAGRDSPLSGLQELFSYLVFDALLPDIRGGPRVGKVKDLRRLVLSAFYHADLSHLIHNMVSLLAKGLALEETYGSKKFASMVAVLLGLSHGLFVLSSKLIDTFAGIPGPLYSCSAGFSAVLLAMKVVSDQMMYPRGSNFVDILGFAVPIHFAVWAELATVHLVFQDSSLLGHLCGILAGFVYVLWQRGSIKPLSWILSPISFLLRLFSRVGSGISSRTMASLRLRRFPGVVHSLSSVTSSAPPGSGGNSDATPSAPPGSGGGLPIEELRQRRLERLARNSRR